MALSLYRIYDQIVGQLAGIRITTTSKGDIKQDGTEAFAQGVVLIDSDTGLPYNASGGGGGSATAANQVTEIGLLGDLVTAAEDDSPVNIYPFPTTPVTGLTGAITDTTSTAVAGMGAPAGGSFNYITGIVIGNSHATVGTFVDLQDGNGGTVFATFPAAPAYGGVAFEPTTPIKQPTAATALYARCKTTGANVIVTAVGFQAPAPT